MPLLDHKFSCIPEDKRIVTDSFLNSCDKIVEFFEVMGKVFTPVKSDVSGNVAKIRKRFEENPKKFRTLNDLIDTELAETDKALKVKNQGIATNALMWLRRGLQFISLFFSHLLKEDYVTKDNSKRILKNCAVMAYEGSLKKYHGMLIGGVFKLAMRASPYREVFLSQIAGCETVDEFDDKKEEETIQAIKDFGINFDLTIDVIQELFKEKNVENDYTV
ncbi:glycolipid transfer protein A-like [Styela clava]|uniref:glycolipid transfer protein A-like n=1 Tax=Styela clava TaxID=7725 RepID=UPI00193A8A09|nr:glycolipid transfer protein A-like [Styela clava]